MAGQVVAGVGAPLTPRNLVLDLVAPSEARISPDGSTILYTLSTTDRTSGQLRTQLWLRNRDGSNPRQLTSTGNRNRGGVWSPDGSAVAFVSDRVGGSGIFVLPVSQAGEPREVLRDPREIGELTWSPDGQWLAYVVMLDPSNPTGGAPATGAPPAVRVTRRPDYKSDGRGYLGERRRQIFVVGANGGPPRQLTTDTVDHGMPQWSPDGRCLALQVAHRAGMGHSLGLIDLCSGDMRRVGWDAGAMGVFAWSPGGDRILFAGDTTVTAHLDFFVYDVATGEIRMLRDDLECLVDAGRLGQAPPASPVWLDERTALFHAFHRGMSELYTLDTHTGATELVKGYEAIHAGLSLDAQHRYVVQTRVSLAGPGVIALLDLQQRSESVLSNDSADLLREHPPALWERFDIQRAGLTIQAWLLKPPDFDPARRYPVILDIHGGPQAFHGYGFDPVHQLLATNGFIVVYSNPRGSTTYGRDFTLRVRQDWGGEDFKDLMAVVDAVIQRPYADADRLGIYGSSYGGYMTAWTITQTDRFKAAVSRAPVFDLESFYGTSDIGFAWSHLQFGGPPHEHREWYAAHSPSTFAHRVKAATLIICGETDDRCPIGQAEQMFIALCDAGCDVEFARYPGGSHLFFRPGGVPEHRIDFFERVLSWFQTRLGTAA